MLVQQKFHLSFFFLQFYLLLLTLTDDCARPINGPTSGVIPTELGRLASVRELGLHTNRLTGALFFVCLHLFGIGICLLLLVFLPCGAIR